jgi:hypothetical protein
MEPGDVLSPNGVGATALVKYGCERASAADILSAGSNFNSLSNRSIAVRII